MSSDNLCNDNTYGFCYMEKHFIWGNFSNGSPKSFGNDRLSELKYQLRTSSLGEWKEKLGSLKIDDEAENPSVIDKMRILMSGGNPKSCVLEKKMKSTFDYALSLGYYQSGSPEGLDYSYVVDLDKECFIVGDEVTKMILSFAFDNLPENLGDCLDKYHDINPEVEGSDTDDDESNLGKRKRIDDDSIEFGDVSRPFKKQKLD